MNGWTRLWLFGLALMALPFAAIVLLNGWQIVRDDAVLETFAFLALTWSVLALGVGWVRRGFTAGPPSSKSRA